MLAGTSELLHPGLRVWFVPPPQDLRESAIEAVRQGPKGPLLTLAGIDGVDAASTLRGRTLIASRHDLSDVLEDSPEDIVGIEVWDEEHGLLGTIEDIIETGANDVWVVQGEVFGEVLIPVIESVVLEIDHESARARVRLLEGLLPEGGERA